MKKILLSLCLATMTCILGYSQVSLSLSDSIGAIPKDSTVVKTGSDTLAEIDAYFFVTNNSANPIQVMVRKVEHSLMDSCTNYFCWGLCYGFGTYISIDSVEIRAGATNKTDFSGHYQPHKAIGVSTIRYVFYDKNNIADSVGVNVKYDTRALGINNTLLTSNSKISVFPNPSDNVANFAYKLTQGTSASVIIRNILGSVVKEFSLDNQEGKIAITTADLSNGIYFYSLLENGISKSTRKLIVKH